jgi:hypothetical protein
VKRYLTAVAILIIAVLFSASSCEKANEPFKDAKRGETNNSPADTITMPDGFNNVASKCDGPNRVYVVFHSDAAYGSVAVVPNDPRCTGEVQ